MINFIILATPASISTVNGKSGLSVSLVTDDIAEGTTNKYFSNTLARNAISATAPLAYNAGTGVISLGTLPTTNGGTGLTGIGTSGQVLTVSGGVPAWATASAGGMTSIASGTLSGATVTLSSIPSTYKALFLQIQNPYLAAGGSHMTHRINGVSTASSYRYYGNRVDGGNTYSTFAVAEDLIRYDQANQNLENVQRNDYFSLYFPNYASTNGTKMFEGSFYSAVSDRFGTIFGSQIGIDTTAINSVTINTTASTFAGGTYTLFGVS